MSLMSVSSVSPLDADHLGVSPLLGRQLCVQQQAGHADDAVHRGADLVAHVGQETALGAAAGFRRFLSLEQFFFGLLSFRDIEDVPSMKAGRPSSSGCQADVLEYPDGCSIFSLQPDLGVRAVCAPGRAAAKASLHVGAIVEDSDGTSAWNSCERIVPEYAQQPIRCSRSCVHPGRPGKLPPDCARTAGDSASPIHQRLFRPAARRDVREHAVGVCDAILRT